MNILLCQESKDLIEIEVSYSFFYNISFIYFVFSIFVFSNIFLFDFSFVSITYLYNLFSFQLFVCQLDFFFWLPTSYLFWLTVISTFLISIFCRSYFKCHTRTQQHTVYLQQVYLTCVSPQSTNFTNVDPQF